VDLQERQGHSPKEGVVASLDSREWTEEHHETLIGRDDLGYAVHIGDPSKQGVSKMLNRVCVFCGSNCGMRSVYRESARELGTLLASRGIGLVFGGGRVGLMGAMADAALAAGGQVIGVIPQALVDKELAHRGVTELRVVDSMHQRKALMAELSDAFIALPGGYGTLEEFCEVLTWSQLGFHWKACGILNVAGYYDHLMALFDHAVAESFVHEAHRRLMLVEERPERLLDRLAEYHPPAVEKWLDWEET